MKKFAPIPFGTEEVKIDSVDISEFLPGRTLPTTRVKQPFRRYVRTIPLSWATKAASLKGKSAAIAMMLWYYTGVSKNSTVTVSGVKLRAWGIQRNAGYRALKWLEEAGLVKVERNGNKSPRVTILEIEDGG